MSPFPEVSTTMGLTQYRKPPGASLAGGMMQSGLIGGEILPARDYRGRQMY
jgi:hypothetical protein